MNTSLGDRMKEYEYSFRYTLPRRTYTIIRIDGKAFHTYTKELRKPFDEGLIKDMNNTAIYLCEQIMGAKFAYVQSDEISILITDFDALETQPWFKNNIQKMVSVAASMATAKFNQLRLFRYFAGPKDNIVTNDSQIDTIGEHYMEGVNLEDVRDDIASFCNYLPIKNKLAEFDARIWQIPQQVEVYNYFMWRQQDAIKNSISTVAQSLYSHGQLQNKNSEEKKEMILRAGVNWDNLDSDKKFGRLINRITFVNGKDITTIPNKEIALTDVVRNKWCVTNIDEISKDKSFLQKIPRNND